MVPFAGYEMPVQYPAGILKEHLHTREKAGLFDVSHMGQAFLAGDTARAGAGDPRRCRGPERGHAALWPAADRCRHHQGRFHVLAPGRRADLYLVVNAGTKEGDFAYIAEKLKGAATLTPRFDRALAGAAGARGRRGAGTPSPGISDLTFMKVRARHRCRRARHRQPHRLYRRGWFEISTGRRRCRDVWRARCWAKAKCCPSGWAPATACGWKPGFASMAMTSTRPVNPAEAGLLWSIGKRRKEAKDFPGADRSEAQRRHQARRPDAGRPRARPRRRRDRRKTGG